MSDVKAAYSRIQRRETHASRSAPAVVTAVVLVLALAYLVTEIVLGAAGQQPLLASPAQMVTGLTSLGGVPAVWFIVGGIVLVLLALVLIVLALGGGRRSRHVLQDDRAVVVVDNEVIASALVRAAADADSVDPDRAVAAVTHRAATVRVTPSSGVGVNSDAIRRALDERLQAWGLKPALRARVRIEKQGKVGA